MMIASLLVIASLVVVADHLHIVVAAPSLVSLLLQLVAASHLKVELSLLIFALSLLIHLLVVTSHLQAELGNFG